VRWIIDSLSPEHRSWNMSRIRSEATKPEIAVRSILHRMGFRFRLATGRALPGRPDIVLPKHRVVVFVHGCFWHRHKECRYAYTPKSREAFWQQKFSANVARDLRVRQRLQAEGWKVTVVWECELSNEQRIRDRVQRVLRAR
jgi:DNA mismatch endonuclease, patch repair protein